MWKALGKVSLRTRIKEKKVQVLLQCVVGTGLPLPHQYWCKFSCPPQNKLNEFIMKIYYKFIMKKKVPSSGT